MLIHFVMLQWYAIVLSGVYLYQTIGQLNILNLVFDLLLKSILFHFLFHLFHLFHCFTF